MFILALFALQIAGLFSASTAVRARSTYPKVPEFTFARTTERSGEEPLDDPLLFATAHPRGFSGRAWMQPPSHIEKLYSSLPAPTFLNFGQCRDGILADVATDNSDSTGTPDYHIAPEPLMSETMSPQRSSTVRLEGAISGRGLVSSLDLPPQVYNDVLGSSVVQVSVDRDGTVISARLAESSGFKKADLDAVALARQARFGQMKNAEANDFHEVEFGKLIFDWFALDFTSTNAVKR